MKEYIAAATEAGLAVLNLSVPEHIGVGRAKRISVLILTKA